MQILDLVFLRGAHYPAPKCKNGCAGYNKHHAKKKVQDLHLHFKCKIKMSEYNNTTHESEDIQTFRIWNLNQLSLYFLDPKYFLTKEGWTWAKKKTLQHFWHLMITPYRNFPSNSLHSPKLACFLDFKEEAQQRILLLLLTYYFVTTTTFKKEDLDFD